MNTLKESLLSAYMMATAPYRAVAGAWRAKCGTAPIMSLFYHRVADDRPSPWTMPTALFARQIDWLAERFELISLAEAQRRLASGHNARPAVCITFDDGYADNCRDALPLLVERDVPCTYFVTLENVATGRPFPHDRDGADPPAPNTIDELRDFAAAGVEIGAHTRTHPNLAEIRCRERLYDEVIASARELEELVDSPVRYFAFPFGRRNHVTDEVFRLAREHGLAGVCTADGGYNFPGGDAFHLRRIHADPQMSRLVNWLTVDPRKVRP